ncbi:MAB_1171c family putative transporter [Amycolatopsis pittospori]|uniref:MAB_1171c family putative transporter n=1 Tax=Amycolatopsis pittospori TaxID=2749434 RepID=UPI0015F0F9D6|nr:MAB_1171c family putative transporter [Amycolatopsis pittospori]
MNALFSPVNIVAMVLFATALAWRIYQTYRAPRVLPNWAITVTIVCVAGSFLAQQKVISDWLDELTGRGTGRLVNNIMLAVAVCALLIVFLGSALGPRRPLRVFFELIPLAAAIALMFIAMAVTPVEVRGLALSPKLVHEPGVALFYLGAGLYLIYGLLACAWWILRYIRAADRHLKTGLKLSAAGLILLSVGSVFRALYIVIAWAFGPSIPVLLTVAVPLVLLGIVLFLAGITYPGARARFAALRRRRQHKLHHERLTPLWTVLSDVYPNIVLRTTPRGPWDRWRPRTVHRHYYRRVIEIRDGLVQLSPYLETDLTALAVDDPRGAAEALKTALARQAAGEATDGRAKLVLPGGAADIESDVRPLLALSAAVSRNEA